MRTSKGGKIHFVVVGDVGHSPRMVNHCECAVQNGLEVVLVGCLQSEVPNLVAEEKISFYELHTAGAFSESFPALLRILLKGILLFFQLLFYGCFRIENGDKVVVQNPPALPVLVAFSVAKLVRRFKVFVDWHNFGYTLLQPATVARTLYYWMEHVFAVEQCDGHFAVSCAMKNALVQEFSIEYDDIIVCKDKPKKGSAKTTEKDAAKLMEFLCESCPQISRSDFFENGNICSFKNNDRPYVIICATSWTIDERMDILFEALEQYEQSHASHQLYLFITGKGPMKEAAAKRVKTLNLQKVKIFSLWLSRLHYEKLVGFADFGLSLHASSSGFDLPMKVVDYLGGGIPCFCLRYNCLEEELVVEGENGFLFGDALELSYLLLKHLDVPRSKNALLARMKENICRMYPEKWDSYWKSQVLHTLTKE